MRLVAGYAEVDDVESFVDDLAAIGREHDCTVQAIDARYVAGRRHVERAVALADRAIERGEAIARDRGVEILLYAAGTRQIDRAFEIGVSEGRSPTVVVIAAAGDTSSAEDDGDASEREAAEAVEELLETAPFEDVAGDRERLREWFEIGDAELSATDASLKDLVFERVALLVVER